MNDLAANPFARMESGIEKVRAPLETARHLPGEFYSSPSIAALEKERIFLKTWLCVGREEEIPEPGDYVTCQVADEPFVLSRTKAGDVAAFMNMCLHRGVAVVEGRGNAKDFSCPYHAWLYDIEGRLIVAPKMQKSEADLKDCRLRPLRIARWRGWIFVSFNPDAEPFEEFIAVYESNLWWFQTEQCRLAEKMVIDVDCNWKLLTENLVDIYHVPVLHKGTFGSFNNYSNLDVKLLKNGAWAYDQKAKSHSKSGQQTFPTLPWLEGMSSDTSSRAGIFPNLNISMRYDSLRMWQVWPLSPTRTQLQIYLMFPLVAFEQPDFRANLEDYKGFVSQLVNEDVSMVKSLQHAMKSPYYEPGLDAMGA